MTVAKENSDDGSKRKRGRTPNAIRTRVMLSTSVASAPATQGRSVRRPSTWIRSARMFLLVILLGTVNVARSECPSTPKAIAKEMSSYVSVLGTTSGWLSCCVERFPKTERDMTLRYNHWAAPGRKRLEALLECVEQMETNAKDVLEPATVQIRERLERDGRVSMCDEEPSQNRCRETLHHLFTTTTVQGFAKMAEQGSGSK